ncbi:hypothetical protein DDB_G0273559 [Dictyostelium discoideum AX4]|uniref:VPS35 endosomal protein sorting factor-like n=1 Tax=Dictyostelium discoideum TaxID=44689 RepID=VP35L_DICDI|nr:hypothetical protein DDB_G0273473 [Dictyostelium discoideum AX4]XP_644662.1 hypothetical protein DDB_G0273559 [Dictyostelium discoideum AX4]Q557H3.1 RecName: Full=VPS35 endosomal protein sorting factor-like [Dictyostelium discoideum]EAL70691.1 hypothetical protein DDB_G0273473 [Dictyostelium discoideum AX4]EAL70734.1 hypothetical protein DDB_G0273559 [Dictyostelium discoideum AX4]|eukprot:XP_644589.1 hypothetical protein DDB_G0273473 [Dictyostelium discoideum AX4]
MAERQSASSPTPSSPPQQQQQTPQQPPQYLLNSKKNFKVKVLNGREVERHPLNSITKTEDTGKPKQSSLSSNASSLQSAAAAASSSTATTDIDPLNNNNNNNTDIDPLNNPLEKKHDPLSETIATMGGLKLIKENHLTNYVDENFMPWDTLKPSILQQYTSDDSNPIQVSFMSTGTSGKIKIPINRLNKILEELEQDKEDSKSTQFSQPDIIMDLETLHSELLKAWAAEERVRSLKIAIQTAKLLSDTSLIKFYPSKFVIATEILDTFGNLVYDRIKKRLQSSKESKNHEILLKEQAKETCRNWFYKIASIRELLPRLFVEISILKCYEFIQGDVNTEPKQVINRISEMIRGIGNPLVANYIRAYLTRRSFDLCPEYKKFVIQLLKDFVFTQKSYEKSKYLENTLSMYRITLTDYMGLYSPSLEWLLQCLAHKATPETLEEVLELFRESKNSLLLNHIISSFPPEYICSNSTMFSNFIKDADTLSYPKYQLYSTFGVNLVLGQPPKNQILSILNDVWKVVTNFENIKDYISVAEVFIEYVLTHCSEKETDVFLKDILRHIIPDKGYETIQSHLQSIVLKIFTHISDFGKLVSFTNFLPLLDLFNGESQKQISRSTLEALSTSKVMTSDPILINTFLTYGKALHDSLNSLSFQDEVRQVTQLVVNCINKIDFGRDVEKQLNFYVECRQTFINFDGVKNRLVYGVCEICEKTLNLVKGKHTPKTTSFIRACVAYCFITIPSIDDIFLKMNLYLVSSSVALQNQALSQADALLKAAITFIQEIPPILEFKQVKSTEDWTISYVSDFISLLVVTPGHPESGPFYLVKALYKVIKEYQWESSSTAKSKLFIQLLLLCSSWAQTSLPYHIEKVESNDQLFTEDPEFNTELTEFYNSLIKEILYDLNLLKDEPDNLTQKKVGIICIDLINALLNVGELNSKTASLIFNLYNMAKKIIPSTCFNEITYLKNTLAFIGTLESKMGQDIFNKLSQQQ